MPQDCESSHSVWVSRLRCAASLGSHRALQKGAITRNTCTSARPTVTTFPPRAKQAGYFDCASRGICSCVRWKGRPGVLLTPLAAEAAAAKAGSENTRGWPEVCFYLYFFVAWLSDGRGVCATVTPCQTHRDSSVSSDVSGSSLCGSGIISKP